MGPDSRELHHAHEDERNRARALERREQEATRQADEKWWRRVAPLLPDPDTAVEDIDFPGCVFT